MKRMNVLHTSKRLDMDERRQRLDAIKNTTLIISTNLLAHAIDIESLRIVINFDLPADRRTDAVDKKMYMYRIGRCSRFGKQIIYTIANSHNSHILS